jgi:uncharacterized iron-regulated protein
MSFLATKPLTTRETEAMKQAARSKRKNSSFRTAPDGRLVIDMDDEDEDKNQRKEADEDEDDEDRREDLKDLMETLSLGQLAKNKRKRALEHDDDDDGENDNHQYEDQQSSRSRYRGKRDRLDTCEIYSNLSAGGGGIHRNLNSSSNGKQQQQQKKRPGEAYKTKVKT